MEKQLYKSCINSLLQSTGMQQATGRVRSESLQEEMSLIGFIPYHRSNDLSESDIIPININSDFILSPYRIRLKDIKNTFPITQQVSIAKGRKYFVERTLTTYITEKINKPHLSKYFENQTHSWADAVLRSATSNKIPANSLSKNDQGLLEFTANNDDLEFRRNTGEHIWVYNDFLCLCTFINKVTGLPSYAVFPPEDTIRILSDKDDEESELLF